MKERMESERLAREKMEDQRARAQEELRLYREEESKEGFFEPDKRRLFGKKNFL